MINLECIVRVWFCCSLGQDEINLRDLKTSDCHIEIAINFQKMLQFYGEYRCVLTRFLGESVVGNHVCAYLVLCKTFQPDRRDSFHAKQLCRLYAAMAGDYCAFAIDQNWICKTKFLDACSDLSKLVFRMRSGIVGMGCQRANWLVDDS
jgi:hypothetical protein